MKRKKFYFAFTPLQNVQSGRFTMWVVQQPTSWVVHFATTLLGKEMYIKSVMHVQSWFLHRQQKLKNGCVLFCFLLVCSFLPLLLPSLSPLLKLFLPDRKLLRFLITRAWDACDQRKNVGSDVTHANYSCGCQAKMATRKQLHSSHSFDAESCEGGRELFEACRNGDVTKVRRIVNINPNVNIRDTAGRKSSPLHFAAGKNRMKTNRMAVARWCQLHFFSKEKE